MLKSHAIRTFSWFAFSLPLCAQFIYGKFFCHYSFIAPFTLMFLLSIPAMIWLMKKSYLASMAASVGVFFCVVWENHIQCVSEDGPFVGGLGPIYLIVLGLFISVILGLIFGWIEKRFLTNSTQ